MMTTLTHKHPALSRLLQKYEIPVAPIITDYFKKSENQSDSGLVINFALRYFLDYAISKNNFATQGVLLDDVLFEVECAYVKKVFEKVGGSKKKSAKLLSINTCSLRYRLDKFNIV